MYIQRAGLVLHKGNLMLGDSYIGILGFSGFYWWLYILAGRWCNWVGFLDFIASFLWAPPVATQFSVLS